MVEKNDRFLANILLKHNILPELKIRECLDLVEKSNQSHNYTPLQKIIVAKGYLSSEQMATICQKIQEMMQVPETMEALLKTQNAPANRSPEKNLTASPISSSLVSHLEVGQMFAHYKLEKELGRGGMGVVFQAYDTKLDRMVALKLILSGEQVNEYQVKRFMREARATAKLDHPYIINVYEVGEKPQNYFTMEYIEGSNLSSLIKSGKLDYKKMATIFKKCSEGLQCAHENNIVHRDIKPANIMLTKKHEPRIMDFGLVKVEGAEEKLSMTGGMMGTPAYMPPEQADGRNVDRRTDIYALGASLYEALTGRPPFQGSSYLNILRQVYSEEPLSPRMLNPDIPLDLEAICLKCLEKKANKRYVSAKTLAQDFQNFLENKPVKAKPANTATRLRKWFLRNKAITFVSLGATLIIIFSLVLFVTKIQEEKEIALKAKNKAQEQEKKAIIARQFAEKQQEKLKEQQEQLEAEMHKTMDAKKQAEQSHRRALDAVYFSNLTLADKLIEDDELKKAKTILNDPEQVPLNKRNWEWLWLNKKGHLEQKSWSLAKKSQHCSLSPYGSRVAIAMRGIISVWSLSEGKEIFQLKGHKKRVSHCVYSPDGLTIASSGFDKKVIIWDAQRGEKKQDLTYPLRINSCAFSPDGKWLATSHVVIDNNPNDYFAVIVRNISDGKIICKLAPYEARVWNNDVITCAFHPNGYILASAGQDWEISIWDLRTKQKIKVLKGHQDNVNDCQFSPDGKRLISASSDNSIRVWDLSSGTSIFTLQDHRETVETCSYSPNGKFFVSAGNDNNIIIYNAQDAEKIVTLTGHLGRVLTCQFAADNTHLVSVGEDNKLKLWNKDARKKQNPTTLSEKGSFIYSLSLNPENSLISAGIKPISGPKLWDFQTRRPYKTPKPTKENIPFQGHILATRHCEFLPSRNEVTSASIDGTVIIWDLESGKEKKRIWAHDKCNDGKLSPDKSMLATCGEDGKVILWDTKTWERIREITIGQQISRINFAPDGQSMVLTLWRGKIMVVNLQGETEQVFKRHQGFCHDASFSPDGKKIVSGSLGYEGKNNLFVWDRYSGNILATYEGHTRGVWSCLFTNDGKRIVSTGGDRSIRIWDASSDSLVKYSSHKALLTITTQQKKITACLFSSDGKQLITGSGDGHIKIWDTRLVEE